MKFSCRTAVVSGVVGGYFLGRTKKGKLALVLASLFLGRRLGLGPQELIKKGVEKLAETPQIAELGTQVRQDLTKAARAALTSTLNRRIDSISDALHERTEHFAEAKHGEGKKKSTDTAEEPSGSEAQEADEENREPEEEKEEGADPPDGEKESERRSRNSEKRAGAEQSPAASDAGGGRR